MDSNAPGPSEDAPNRGPAIDLTNPKQSPPEEATHYVRETWRRRKKRKTKIWRRRRTYQQNLQRKKRRRRNLIDLRPGQTCFSWF
jgi:hypothetical protein